MLKENFSKKNIRFKKQNTLDPYLCFSACIKMLSSPARVPFIAYTSKYTQNSYTYLNFYDCMYVYSYSGVCEKIILLTLLSFFLLQRKYIKYKTRSIPETKNNIRANNNKSQKYPVNFYIYFHVIASR